MYKVMVVDDSPIIVKDLCDLIDWENFDFTLTGSYTAARDLLIAAKKNLPDLLITDISMPDMDGIALASEITKLDPDISIIFLSAYSDFEYARSGLRLRVFDYLLKPVQISQLVDVMSRLQKKLREKEQKEISEIIEKRFFRDAALTHYLTRILYHPDDSTSIDAEFSRLGVQLPDEYRIYVASITPALPPDSIACFSQGQNVQAFSLVENDLQSTVLILYTCITENPPVCELLSAACIDIEARWNIVPAIGYSTPASSMALLPELYKEAGQAIKWLKESESPAPIISFANIHTGDAAYTEKKNKSIERKNVAVMLDYIHANYGMHGISKKDVAGSAHLSPNYGNLLFSKECGMTIFEYLTQYRMEKARQLLTETDLFVTTVAELVGYESKTSFYLVFKRKFGMSPTEYRQKHTVY